MKKKLWILGIIGSLLIITGCEEENTNVQERQNILDDGVTMSYTYTDIKGEAIVEELLSKIRMPIGSTDEDLFYKNKKLTYQDISNDDLLLLGANIYKTANPEATSMTVEDMNKSIHSIITNEVEVKHKSVKDDNCDKTYVELKGINYDLSGNCKKGNGEYISTIITADDVNNTGIEIAEKVAYVETNGNEKIIYREKNGKEIKRVNINEELNLENTTGLIIVKYTFVMYKDEYYFYSSEII